MSSIPADFGSGGKGLTPNGSGATPDLATTMREMADDHETMRAKFNALLAKLDADGGVTDVNYVSTLEVAEDDILTKKA